MNAIAQQVYDLLMTEPEWFDMQSHQDCIMGALYRVMNGHTPDGISYFHSISAAPLLGLYPLATQRLVCYWPIGDNTNAIAAAQRLKAACDAAQVPVPMPEEEAVLV
jgi:hypothetical protein